MLAVQAAQPSFCAQSTNPPLSTYLLLRAIFFNQHYTFLTRSLSRLKDFRFYLPSLDFWGFLGIKPWAIYFPSFVFFVEMMINVVIFFYSFSLAINQILQNLFAIIQSTCYRLTKAQQYLIYGWNKLWWLIWRDVFPYPIFCQSFEGIRKRDGFSVRCNRLCKWDFNVMHSK